MGQLDALVRAGEDHAVLARDVAAAQRREADVARFARAGVAVAPALALLLEVDLAALCGGLAEQQRGAGGRIDLLVVMHLDDLDVELVAERRRDLSCHHREQIDAEAHVAGLHDRGLLRGLGDLRVIGGRAAGGADDVRELRFGGERRELHGRGRNGEIEDRVRRNRERAHFARHQHAVRRQAGEHAGVLADVRRALAFGRAGEHEPGRLADRLHQRRPMRPPAPATISRMSAMCLSALRAGIAARG